MLLQLPRKVSTENLLSKQISVASFDGAVKAEIPSSLEEGSIISPHSYKIASSQDCKNTGLL